jgi:hypothetical protein
MMSWPDRLIGIAFGLACSAALLMLAHDLLARAGGFN